MTNGDGDVSQSPYELVTTPEGVVARISARGSAVLTTPPSTGARRSPDEQAASSAWSGCCRGR